ESLPVSRGILVGIERNATRRRQRLLADVGFVAILSIAIGHVSAEISGRLLQPPRHQSHQDGRLARARTVVDADADRLDASLLDDIDERLHVMLNQLERADTGDVLARRLTADKMLRRLEEEHLLFGSQQSEVIW